MKHIILGINVFGIYKNIILLKKSWKIGTSFGKRNSKKWHAFWQVGTPNWKIGHTLPRCDAKLKNWDAFGTLSRLLARKNEKLERFLHAFHGIYQTLKRYMELRQFFLVVPYGSTLSGTFRTLINIYDGTICIDSQRFLAVKLHFKSSILDV